MSERPIFEMLSAASSRVRAHMPGHAGIAPFGTWDPYCLDTTELAVTDDFYAPQHGILRAQERYAFAAGAGASLFLHNGSTQGVHAMLEMYGHEGDTVILPRNAHLSAQSACILGGFRVQWIPLCATKDGYVYIKETDVLKTIEETPHACCLLLTRPDYYGGCIPLTRIVEKAHQAGIKVCVDEAHGAHLPWLSHPASCERAGVDAWVQSVHKTLPALTGSAVLHLRDAKDRGRAMRVLRREQTSSPSFLLLQSIDDARAWMEAHPDGAKRLSEQIEAWKASLQGSPYAEDPRLSWQKETGYSFDPLHAVIRAPQGGQALMEALTHQGLDAEMADFSNVLFLFGVSTPPEDLRKIRDMLVSIPCEAYRKPVCPQLPTLPETVIDLRQAALSETESIPLAESAGHICAQAVGCYPPGIPVVMPGERIGQNELQILMQSRQNLFGLEGDNVICVRQSYSISTEH